VRRQVQERDLPTRASRGLHLLRQLTGDRIGERHLSARDRIRQQQRGENVTAPAATSLGTLNRAKPVRRGSWLLTGFLAIANPCVPGIPRSMNRYSVPGTSAVPVVASVSLPPTTARPPSTLTRIVAAPARARESQRVTATSYSVKRAERLVAGPHAFAASFSVIAVKRLTVSPYGRVTPVAATQEVNRCLSVVRAAAAAKSLQDATSKRTRRARSSEI
jgi:hypothetical protein